MKSRPTGEWYKLEARSSSKELWALLTWEGKPELGPSRLPDGRHVDDAVAVGDVEALGFPIWFERYQSHRRAGDLIWTGGLGIKIVSERFVDVLTSIGATGFCTYEANIRTKRGVPIPGFVGLGVNSSSDDTDVRNQYIAPTYSFLARPHVVEALRAAGVTELKIKPWRDEDW